MKNTLDQVIVAQGKSLKRRSHWVEAACEDLLQNPDREDLIREEFFDGKTLGIPLGLDSQVIERLDELAQRMTSATRIVDRSSVIRTAITQAVLAAAGRRLTGVPAGDTPRMDHANE
jgi:metal-responsive CopG/Arc/MetJ family transcriptional regulator